MRQRVALVLGASGGIGGEITRSLLKRGWTVRAFARRIPSATGEPRHRHVEWIAGDALRRDDVMNAAHDASVIVHAVNPAKYHNWRGLSLPMLDNTLAAAEANRSRIVFPGTVYNYGRDSFPLVDETASQFPRTVKGAIRVEMEERLRDASWDGRVKTLIVRSGDFFGPRAGSSWLSQGMVMPKQPVRFVMNPGLPAIYHSWAYLPDVAEATARLLESEDALQKFDTFHFRGHWITNGEMAEAICAAAGISQRRIIALPWWLIRASAPLVELSHEMLEMRYLWEEPLQLDNRKLIACLGAEPHTALESAIRSTLIGMGCLRGRQCEPATAGNF
jgi:nucleoside-diphosphate-sugar epimerase